MSEGRNAFPTPHFRGNFPSSILNHVCASVPESPAASSSISIDASVSGDAALELQAGQLQRNVWPDEKTDQRPRLANPVENSPT
jgi:hypothetical protein